MRAPLVTLLCTAACQFEPGQLAVDDAPIGNIDARPIDAAIDSGPPPDARVCPPAPATCSLFQCASSSSCYYLCGTSGATKASWSGAVASCANVNLTLGCIVTINDLAEQNCITQHAAPVYPDILWIGYHQTDNTSEPGGNFNWQCGTSTFTLPPWNSGQEGSEPNDFGGNEDCTALTTSGGWIDASCSGTAKYVCELP